MASCTPSAPVTSLSSLLQRTHLPSSSIARTAAPNDDLAAADKFRTSSPSTSTTRAYAEQDWHNFIAPKPRSQIQACPPFTQFDHGHSSSSSSSWANEYYEEERGFSPADYAAIMEPSARWSPEVETVLEARRNAAASPALSASSYTSVVPTPEEADRICCLSGGDGELAAVCCRRRGVLELAKGEREETTAHPLTMHAASEAEWDFERLFSRRNRWIDGKRSRSAYPPSSRPTEDEEGGTRRNDLAKRRSRSKSRSRLCEEVLPSVAERTVEAHATLRETAMTRLALVVRHLGGEEKMKR